ncbi:polyprenyl synthetase family protein [uncultured Jatrophihabitans sp.]|uniref:polyprenyl synthetase family protein n=1 Tax=uncultured Jatrophihabitans sp. TaxID=1610747 RepID=UPI0035CA14AF
MSERAYAPVGDTVAEPVQESRWQHDVVTHVATVEARLGAELDALQRAWQQAADGVGDRASVGAADVFAAELDPPAQLSDLVRRGGKRTRPVMALLGWQAADVDGTGQGYDDTVQAGVAIELLHCFALVHDDVMDESPMRRGRPTVHADAARRHGEQDGRGDAARFGDSVAILVGDLAQSEAERLAGALPEPMRTVWRHMVLELLAGQVRDVVGSAAGDRRLAFARQVARQKTGYYSVARPLQLGAAAAGAGELALSALEQYGRHAGEAFALRDDLLGVYGDPDTTGKPAGDDIRSGKPTVLLAVARASLRGHPAAALEAAGTTGMTDAQVALVRDAMLHEGVVSRVEAMIDDRAADAVAALQAGTDAGVLTIDGAAHLTRTVDQLARRGN